MHGTSQQSQLKLAGAVLAAAMASAIILPAVDGAATENFDDIAVIVGAVNAALESARTGSVFPWENPETGNRGSIVIERTYFKADETPCRDYVRQTDGTSPKITRGTGCREDQGRWKLTETASAAVEPSPIRPAGTATSVEITKTPETRAPELSSPIVDPPVPISKPRFLSASMPSRSD